MCAEMKTLMNKHLDVFPRGPESHPLEEKELGISRRSRGRRDGLSGLKRLAVRRPGDYSSGWSLGPWQDTAGGHCFGSSCRWAFPEQVLVVLNRLC